MDNVSRRLCKLLASTAIFYSLSLSHAAAASLNERFEPPDKTIVQLESEGWMFINNSNSEGSQPGGWVIDNDAPPQLGAPLFPHSGSNWIGADFSSGANDIVSDWMILPTMTFQQGASLTFFTISTGSDVFPDRLQVLLSTTGSNVGPAGSTSNFGDFTNLLLDINPNYSKSYTAGTLNGYPNLGANSAQPYVEYSVPNLGQFAGDTGHIAFHYFLTDTSSQGSHIAIDDISVNNIIAVPEPPTLTLLSSGAIIMVACVFSLRRRRAILELLCSVT